MGSPAAKDHAGVTSTSRVPGPQPATQPSQRPEPLRQGPLAGRCVASASMVVLFLVPYLGLSSALPTAPGTRC